MRAARTRFTNALQRMVLRDDGAPRPAEPSRVQATIASAAMPPVRTRLRAIEAVQAQRRVLLEQRAAKLDLALAKAIANPGWAPSEIRELRLEAIRAHHEAATGSDRNEAKVAHLERCLDIFDGLRERCGTDDVDRDLMGSIAAAGRDAYFEMATGQKNPHSQAPVTVRNAGGLPLMRALLMQSRAVEFGWEAGKLPEVIATCKSPAPSQLSPKETASLRSGVFPWPGNLPGMDPELFYKAERNVQDALSQLRNPGQAVDFVNLACVLAQDDSYFWRVQTGKLADELAAIASDAGYPPDRREMARDALCVMRRVSSVQQNAGPPGALLAKMTQAVLERACAAPTDPRTIYASRALLFMQGSAARRGFNPARTVEQAAGLLVLERPETHGALDQWARDLRLDMAECAQAAAVPFWDDSVPAAVGELLGGAAVLSDIVKVLSGPLPSDEERAWEIDAQAKRVLGLKTRIASFHAHCGRLSSSDNSSELWLRCGELAADIRLEGDDQRDHLLGELQSGLIDTRLPLRGGQAMLNVDLALGLYFPQRARHSYDLGLVLANTAQLVLDAAESSEGNDHAGTVLANDWNVVLERINALSFEGKDPLMAGLSRELLALAQRQRRMTDWVTQAYSRLPFDVKYDDQSALRQRAATPVTSRPLASYLTPQANGAPRTEVLAVRQEEVTRSLDARIARVATHAYRWAFDATQGKGVPLAQACNELIQDIRDEGGAHEARQMEALLNGLLQADRQGPGRELIVALTLFPGRTINAGAIPRATDQIVKAAGAAGTPEELTHLLWSLQRLMPSIASHPRDVSEALVARLSETLMVLGLEHPEKAEWCAKAYALFPSEYAKVGKRSMRAIDSRSFVVARTDVTTFDGNTYRLETTPGHTLSVTRDGPIPHEYIIVEHKADGEVSHIHVHTLR